MLRLALFFAGGGAYFLGLALIILAPILTRTKNRFLKVLKDRFLAVGIILVLLSSTPAPIWYDAILVLSLVAWILLRTKLGDRVSRWRDQGRLVVILACVLGLVLEWPHRLMPRVSAERAQRLYVLGDTLLAESADRPKAWPQFLASAHTVEVNDQSCPGGNLDSTIDLVEDFAPGPCVVVLSVGINDVWGEMSVGQFEEKLTTLLKKVQASGRQLVMFEVPVPLFGYRYGWAQRRLASEYGVKLVPKRLLAGLISESDSQPGDLHLSQPGHGQLAMSVWDVVQPAFENR